MPSIPDNLGPRGSAFVAAALDAYDFSLTETQALFEAARILDLIDTLEADVAAHGAILPNGRPSPLIAEIRQQRVVLTRVLGLISTPLPEQPGAVGSVSTAVDGQTSLSPRSRAARKAANARYGR